MTTDRLFEVLYQMPAFPEVLRGHTDYGAKFRKHVDGLVAFNTYPHQHVLLSVGGRAEEMYFLNRGNARGYKYEEGSGKEITLFCGRNYRLWWPPTVFSSAGLRIFTFRYGMKQN